MMRKGCEFCKSNQSSGGKVVDAAQGTTCDVSPRKKTGRGDGCTSARWLHYYFGKANSAASCGEPWQGWHAKYIGKRGWREQQSLCTRAWGPHLQNRT